MDARIILDETDIYKHIHSKTIAQTHMFLPMKVRGPCLLVYNEMYDVSYDVAMAYSR